MIRKVMVRPAKVNARLSRRVPSRDRPRAPARAFPGDGPSVRKGGMSERLSFAAVFRSAARRISCPARA